MCLLHKRFAKRIIVDLYPTFFTFICEKENCNVSVPTLVFLGTDQLKTEVVAIGEPPKYPTSYPIIQRIDVFSADAPSLLKTTLTREDLISYIFEFGILNLFTPSIIPNLKPLVFLLGADRFTSILPNSKALFEKCALRAGAIEVFFDTTEF
jgi:hypothetical protein